MPEPITFVCWKWLTPGYRSKFPPSTVNVLYSMLKRCYQGDFELVCVTDNPQDIRPEVRIVPLWKDHSMIPSPHGHGYPSCYRRLKMFSKEAKALFGPRFVSIDLDVVLTGDVTALFDHDLDFKMYGDTARGTPYNGSLIQHKAGTRTKLWEQFDPRFSPQHGLARRYIGSDQAWIGVCLGPNEPKFTAKDGVYSYRNEIKPKGGRLPQDAKIAVFHGNINPWTPEAQERHPWIAQHYR